jgi:hypothetical protein
MHPLIRVDERIPDGSIRQARRGHRLPRSMGGGAFAGALALPARTETLPLF